MEHVKLKEMIDAALIQTGEECGMLLGQQLRIDASDNLNTNKASFFDGMEDAIFVANIESREEYTGQLYMIFSLRDAILLSGLLLGIPPARVSEKRKLAILEADDIDAFGEIMNQIIGSFNSTFKPKLPNKIHLKLNAPKKFIPGMDEVSEAEPIPSDDYVLFRAQLHMDGMEMDRLDILIPTSLAQQMEPPSAEPDPAASPDEKTETEKAAVADQQVSEAGETPPAPSIANKTILLLDDDVKARESVRIILDAAGLKVVDASFRDDIRELFDSSDATVALICVADTEDRELALCIKIKAMSQGSPLSIIMCAPNWTRTGILKALKYGAKDILLQPCDAGELVTKVSRFLKAA